MQRADPVRALVTGGAGFIGSHLAEALMESGASVRILDDFSTGRRENLPQTECIEGNIRDRATVRRAVEGMEVVYHLAALASVPRSVEDPVTTNAVNVGGTFLVLAEAARAGVRRVLFASSSSVYGESETLPKREDLPPDPLSPYAVSKCAGEIACRSFASSCGLETISLRFFNVYGPRQDPSSPYAAVIPIFLSKLATGGELPIFGDGKQTRDFTFVGDVVRGMMRAANAPGVSGLVINLPGGDPVTVLDLASAAGRAMGVEPRLRFLPPRAGDVRHSYGDGTRARTLLGFRPEVGLEEGLKRTAEGYRR